MLITTYKLKDWGACWPDVRIALYANGREWITHLDLATDESIPAQDRIWVLCHVLAEVDLNCIRKFAAWCAKCASHCSTYAADASAAAYQTTQSTVPSIVANSASYAAVYAAYAAGKDIQAVREAQIAKLVKLLENK